MSTTKTKTKRKAASKKTSPAKKTVVKLGPVPGADPRARGRLNHAPLFPNVHIPDDVWFDQNFDYGF